MEKLKEKRLNNSSELQKIKSITKEIENLNENEVVNKLEENSIFSIQSNEDRFINLLNQNIPSYEKTVKNDKIFISPLYKTINENNNNKPLLEIDNIIENSIKELQGEKLEINNKIDKILKFLKIGLFFFFFFYKA